MNPGGLVPVLVPFGIEADSFLLRCHLNLAERSIAEAGLLHARRRPPVITTFDSDEVTRFVGTHFFITYCECERALSLDLSLALRWR